MKKLIRISTAILILLMLLISFDVISDALIPEISIEYIEEGSVIIVKYPIVEGEDYLIRIRNQDVLMYYGLNDSVAKIPMVVDDGAYTISILRHKVDNLYSVIFTHEVIVNHELEDGSIEIPDAFISSNNIVNWNNEMTVINFLKGWNTLDVFTYLKYNLEYDHDYHDDKRVGFIPDIEYIFYDGNGMCYEFSILLAAVLRSNDIPCKVVHGYYGEDKVYHAWNEVLIDGEWKILDLSNAIVFRTGTYISYIYSEPHNYEKLYEY